MIIYKKANDIKNYLSLLAKDKKSIGFVPTMGALHEGHLSLARTSKAENDVTVVSIFVNPTQFNDPADLEKYPVSTEKDILLLDGIDVDVLFLPDQKEIYPDGTDVEKNYNLGPLENVLEGVSRPGHFQGVARVMDVLLRIVNPDRLYLGQKDFQQVKVIQRLIDLQGLGVQIVAVPIVREESGLAMSSRNQRLDAASRKMAGIIFQQLQFIRKNADHQTFSGLKKAAIEKLEKAGIHVDYLVLANRENLEQLKEFDSSLNMMLLIAVQFQGIRLIDNLQI